MGEENIEQPVANVDPPVDTEPVATTPPPVNEKPRGFFSFLRKRSEGTQSIPATDNKDALPPETTERTGEEPIKTPAVNEQANPESIQDPEALKADLRESLVRLVDMQVEERFKTLNLQARHLNPDNQELLEEKAKIEKLHAETAELNIQLLDRLDSARGVLGSFCKVIEDKDGNKAFLLRTPLTREVTQATLNRPFGSSEKAEPLYKTHSQVSDVFVVNKEGVYRHSVEDPEAHVLETVGNVEFDEPRKVNFGGQTLRMQQEAIERSNLQRTKRQWHDELNVVLNDKPDKDNQYTFNQFTAGLYQETDIEGQEQFGNGLSEPLHRSYGSYGPKEQILKVTTSLDVAAAFDASVEEAKNHPARTEPDPPWLNLFDPQPNPVSAEPVATDNWNPEPYESQPEQKENSKIEVGVNS